MATKNGKIWRVDDAFDEFGREFAKKNNLKLKEATKEIANALKEMEGKKKVRRLEIRF